MPRMPLCVRGVSPEPREEPAGIEAHHVNSTNHDGPTEVPATSPPSGGGERSNRGTNVPSIRESGEGRTNPMTDEEFVSRNTALQPIERPNENASKLSVTSVDLCASPNRKDHHTEEYEDTGLIVRRGQTFDVKVTFDREFNPEHDVIALKFAVGTRPQESKRSVIRVEAKDDLSPSEWGMKIKSTEGSTVSLTVMSSAKAFVGDYDFFVETRRQSGGSVDETDTRYKHDKKITVLFNAWCEDDSVFMDNKDERDEYVMNDVGQIWVGSAFYSSGKPWKFGQFDDKVLDAALYLLRTSKMQTSARAAPIHVVRCISAMVNSNDEGGILAGRWTATYPDDSTPPTAWTGSVKIIRQYMETKSPVRFGQCWVFSGVVTSLCRSLGIPTRSITNFQSAHDTDASMTIDYHYDKHNNPLAHLDDSVWNFHVWNEAWFRRPDLPEGHDGWQVFDATPQETSEGVFCCGPASVKAVKNGEVYLPYDTPFVFAEVNGDEVYWTVKKDGSMEVDSKDKGGVGLKISTKAVGKDEREDVTSHYKHRENSTEERNAVRAAHAYSSRADEEIYVKPHTDVTFNLDVKHDVKIGDAFDVTVQMTNDSAEVRTVKTTISSKIAFYTGVPVKDLKRQEAEYQLQPGGTNSVVLSIEPGDYLDKLTADGAIRIYVKAKVAETGQVFAKQDLQEFVKPEIQIEFDNETPSVGDEVQAKLSFRNPLPVPLTRAEFLVDGSYMIALRSDVVRVERPVDPGALVEGTVVMRMYREGRRKFVASFRSDQLGNVHGMHTVTVVEKGH